MIALIFFFQAEDGIRDLVRSRGLGDVYKRQALASLPIQYWQTSSGARVYFVENHDLPMLDINVAVSYTHLTLPTSDLV